MAQRRSLYAYAMLQSAVEAGATNPVHALVPLISHSLQEKAGKALANSAIQDAVARDWGISIPINVIRFCLGQSPIRESITRDPGGDGIKVLKAGNSVSREAEQRAKDRYSLIAREINRTKLRESSTNMTVDEVIFKWLDAVSEPTFAGGPTTVALTPDEAEANRLVILTLSSTVNLGLFKESITDLALGNILYQSIVYASEFETLDPDPDPAKVRMDRVTALFDTGIIFRALGYFGPDGESAAHELLQMCRATGCGIAVFEHTVEEAREGLLAFASRFYSGSGAYGPMLDWALSSGMTKADLVDEATIISERLKGLGIKVRGLPPLTTDLSISETQLDYEVEVGVRQDNPLARRRDVDSLAGVYRLREGSPKKYLENCVAIFVTSNPSLARSATKFFNREFVAEGMRPGVQLCMTDVTFSTRLWTKLPTRLGLAPREQVLAKSIAQLRPNKELRENFTRQLEKLVARGGLAEEKATFIRLTSFADRLLALEFEGRRRDISAIEAEDIVQSALRSFEGLVKNSAVDMANAETNRRVLEIKAETDRELIRVREDAAIKTLEAEESKKRADLATEQLARIDAGYREAADRARRKAEALGHLRHFSQALMGVLMTVVVVGTFWQSSHPNSPYSRAIAPWLVAMLAFATVGSFFPRHIFSSAYSAVALRLARRIH